MVTHIPTGLLLLVLLLLVPGKGPALDAIEQHVEVVFVDHDRDNDDSEEDDSEDDDDNDV